MKFRVISIFAPALAVSLCLPATTTLSQQPLTWDELKTRFEANNPELRAGALAVDEMKSQEITAHLRPNPQFTSSTDGTQIASDQGHWTPLSGTQFEGNLSYLHERDHKRELRLESAKQGTQISSAQYEDLERNLLFSLRMAFVQTLQAKTVLTLAKDDLAHYDNVIQISRDRFNAGDIAQIDLDRIELLRVQYESEIQTATVNLRTAKIGLLQLLNERTPVEQFDIDGPFDFSDSSKPIEDLREDALNARPDLRAALASLQQADTNHTLAQANGSTDPTLSGWYTWNPSFSNPYDQQSLGLSVSIPLRVFDRNQGEKKRTQIDIARNRQLTEAARSRVFSDVDSACAQVESDVALLKTYKAKYNQQSTRVRDTVTYAYQHGGASLLDMLNAQSDFRTVQLAYVQLIGSYLGAIAQLNLAVGREVIQ